MIAIITTYNAASMNLVASHSAIPWYTIKGERKKIAKNKGAITKVVGRRISDVGFPADIEQLQEEVIVIWIAAPLAP